MDPVAAKMIGAGIACIGMGGAGIGVGHIFGNFLSGALRNPSAAAAQFTNALIGAALAERERTVVCFTGDGSIMMNIQELVTAAEENVNIKIVLMDNATLGLVHQQQTLFYGERLFASQFRSSPDFVKIAQGFGIAAVDLDASANPCATLMEAISRPGPCLIHASIDAEQKVYPMVPPGAANRDMIGA